MSDNYIVKFGNFSITPTAAEKLIAENTPYLVTYGKVYKLSTFPSISEKGFDYYAAPLECISGQGFIKRGTFTTTNAAGVNRLIGYQALREN